MYLHLFIIALIGFLAYANTFHALFVLDDISQIKNNQMIRDLDTFLYQYNTRRFIGYLSFALNYHFGGGDVKGYHLANLFIHIVNAFLVYFLVKLTFKTPLMQEVLCQRLPVPLWPSSLPSCLFHLRYRPRL